ncbi:MAG: PEGA domain-containing protein [Acidobacteriaceae bacterium]
MVYVWKTWHPTTLRRITFDVYLDARPIAKLDRNRYFVATVTPGKHVFSTKIGSAVELDCEAGHAYYLRMDTTTGLTVGHPTLSRVSEEEGRAAINQAQIIDPKDVIDRSVFASDRQPLPQKPEADSEKVAFQVTSEPPGADISIDGEFKGATPSQLKAVPGPHVLKVSRPGFTDWQRNIVVEAGTAVTFNAILAKETPEPTR